MSDLKKPTQSGSGGDILGFMNSFMEQYLRQFVDGMTPVRVEAVSGHTVTVQPLVSAMATDGSAVRKAKVSGVPIFKFGSSKLFASVPVKKGDFGWCIAGDVDPSLVYQGEGKQDIPNTSQTKKFQFGVFFPFHLLTGSGASVSNPDAFTIQNADGSVAIEVTDTKIIFKGESEFKDKTTFEKQVHMKDSLQADKGMTHDGITIDSLHAHDKVQSGNQTSGGVVRK